MFDVVCPSCHTVRQVRAKKPWMKGLSPYEKICKKCCQAGKPKTESTKRKLSKSAKKAQTPEVLQRKSDFMITHPEFWVVPGTEAAHAAWRGQHHTEEGKKRIADGVRKAKEHKNELG